jgi:hypothetical protein
MTGFAFGISKITHSITLQRSVDEYEFWGETVQFGRQVQTFQSNLLPSSWNNTLNIQTGASSLPLVLVYWSKGLPLSPERPDRPRVPTSGETAGH